MYAFGSGIYRPRSSLRRIEHGQNLYMPIYEYRCTVCGEISSLMTSVSNKPQAIDCEHCGSNDTVRVISLPSVRLSNLSKVESLDPKYDKMVDTAMASNPAADPDRLINRRGDISKGRRDD